MSVDDADAFVASAVAPHGPPLVLHDVVIFVDFHEDNTRKGPSFAHALRTIDAITCSRRVVQCRLETGDVVIARVIAGAAAPGTTEAVAAAANDRNIRLRGGIAASTLLADPATTMFGAILAIERKTADDLVNSIRSAKASGQASEAHMATQIAELTDYCAACGARPMLLVEGYIAHVFSGEPVGSMPEIQLMAFIVDVYLTKGFACLQTINVPDSARQVLQMMRLAERRDIMPGTWIRLPPGTAEPSIQVRKERNDDTARAYRSTLQLTRGVSDAWARAIQDVFPSIPRLVGAFAAAPDVAARAALVSELKVNNRRLGGVLAARLVARFHDGDGEPASPAPAPSPSVPRAPKRKKAGGDTSASRRRRTAADGDTP